jgi:hypothetical protein
VFKLFVLALFLVCHSAVASAQVCECADRAPRVPVYHWMAAVAYTVLSVLSMVLLVRHLVLGEPTAAPGDGIEPG